MRENYIVEVLKIEHIYNSLSLKIQVSVLNFHSSDCAACGQTDKVIVIIWI